MSLTPLELNSFIDIIYAGSGIMLDESKGYLLESRLRPILQKHDLQSYSELLTKIKFDLKVKTSVIDAISTNETYFFRDNRPFELIKNHLIPEILGATGNSLKVWSAACSTGQEAYSLAMLLKELLFDFSKYHVQIHGSDISESAVYKANQGVYTQFELSRGLNPLQINRYFRADGRNFKISDELRSVVQFRKENILQTRGLPQSYNLILCRNVAIYFNRDDKVKLFSHIHKLLKRDGYLIIGSTESISYVNHLFQREQKNGVVYYTKK